MKCASCSGTAHEATGQELKRFRDREPLVRKLIATYADTRFLPVEHAWSAIEDELKALRDFEKEHGA